MKTTRLGACIACACAALLAAVACSTSGDAVTGTGVDAGAGDAARPHPDAGDFDGDTDDGGGVVACPADDPTSYAPTWHPPAPAQAACTSAQLDAFDAQFLGPSHTDATRAQFAADNPGCFACLVTDDSAATWGALVRFVAFGGWYSGNLAGCIALREGDASATSCGAKAQADLLCRYAACGTECHPTNATELDAFDACFGPAGSVPTCAPYADQARTCLRDGAADPCEQGSYPDFRTYVRYLGQLFCAAE